ncbi:MAG: lytic transglycosylase domain-containing protein [Nitrospira sp.]
MRFFRQLTLLFLVLLPIEAFSMQIYQYTDASGITHFTNVPTNSRYQKRKWKIYSPHTLTRKQRRAQYDPFIDHEAKAQGIEPALIKAMIRVESDFNTEAVSSAGAQGLMQVMPATAKDLQLEDPFDPEDNIRSGTRYLRYLLDRFGSDVTLALAAYHAGPGNVARYGAIPPITQTIRYVKDVLRFYEFYQGEGRIAP